MIQARMRADASWSDVCILNLSSRGLLVRAPDAPSRGSYLEIRRGPYVIVARVVWSNADRFGARTQEVIPADGLIHQPDRDLPKMLPDGQFVERRATARSTRQKHEDSRWQSRSMEFAAIALLGAVGAMLSQGAMEELLARPLATVETALGRS